METPKRLQVLLRILQYYNGNVIPDFDNDLSSQLFLKLFTMLVKWSGFLGAIRWLRYDTTY